MATQMAKRTKLRLIKTPTYVGIERATILGPDLRKPEEGQVYIAQSDGSLRPMNGKELVDLFSNYPAFVKGWRPEG
jgi:hypothetical protein